MGRGYTSRSVLRLDPVPDPPRIVDVTETSFGKYATALIDGVPQVVHVACIDGTYVLHLQGAPCTVRITSGVCQSCSQAVCPHALLLHHLLLASTPFPTLQAQPIPTAGSSYLVAPGTNSDGMPLYEGMYGLLEKHDAFFRLGGLSLLGGFSSERSLTLRFNPASVSCTLCGDSSCGLSTLFNYGAQPPLFSVDASRLASALAVYVASAASPGMSLLRFSYTRTITTPHQSARIRSTDVIFTELGQPEGTWVEAAWSVETSVAAGSFTLDGKLRHCGSCLVPNCPHWQLYAWAKARASSPLSRLARRLFSFRR